MAKKQKTFSLPLTIAACLLAFVIGAVAGFAMWTVYKNPKGGDVYVSGDLQIHFMELGNNYTGDSIYIKAGETDILIDAGSRANSTDATSEYIDRYCCETIIDFALTNKTTQVYQNYVKKRDAAVAQGAKHYNALQCYKGENGAQRVYELSDGIKMEILYQEFYENKSSDENNYSVCLMFNQGDKHFLFTGDLEEDGEISLVESNELPKVELFKAGHHGSKTSSNDVLLKVIEPEIVCVCCCAGSVEYTQNFENTFPTQAMIDRVSLYTDRVYVTTVGEVVYNADKEKYEDNGFGPLNGNIVVTSNKSGVNVQCSHDNAVLKNTKWFKDNRTMPSAWS